MEPNENMTIRQYSRLHNMSLEKVIDGIESKKIKSKVVGRTILIPVENKE